MDIGQDVRVLAAVIATPHKTIELDSPALPITCLKNFLKASGKVLTREKRTVHIFLNNREVYSHSFM